MRKEAVMQANKNENSCSRSAWSAIASRICSRWTYPCNRGAAAWVSTLVGSSRFRVRQKERIIFGDPLIVGFWKMVSLVLLVCVRSGPTASWLRRRGRPSDRSAVR